MWEDFLRSIYRKMVYSFRLEQERKNFIAKLDEEDKKLGLN